MPRHVFRWSIVALVGIAATASAVSPVTDVAFMDKTQRAMAKMMANMTVTPSGDVDRDFAEVMIPHHQGAIDMAVSELRYGHNETLRRIAQEIVVDQQQEIVVMQATLNGRGGNATPIPQMIMASGKVMP